MSRMPPRSTATYSQQAGQAYVGSTGEKTKWEWKLRSHSVKLKSSTTRSGMAWWDSENKDGKRLQMMLSLLQLISRGYDSNNCANFKRKDLSRRSSKKL